MNITNSTALPVVESPARNIGVRSRLTLGELRHSLPVLALLCIAMVIAADFLFYGRHLGVTVALFALLAMAAVSIRGMVYLRSGAGIMIAVALAGLCVLMVEHPGTLRMLLAAIALMLLAVLNRRSWTTSVPAWALRVGELIGRCAFQLPVDFGLTSRWARSHGGAAAGWSKTLTNWMLPILLSLVFVGLFALANPIISKWLGTLGDSLGRLVTNFSEYISFARVLLWIAVGFCAWSILRGKTRLGRGRRDVEAVLAPARQARVLTPDVLVRCLILFNLIFVVQMGLDLVTLLSNGAMLPEGMTYSAYARRGAYPLVATALLAAAFVLAAFPSGGAGRLAELAPSMRWARRLVYLWIAQNILLTISAAWRLSMYIEAFGLTRLRIAATVWMALVALGLTFIIWRIVAHRSNSWLLRVNVLTLAIALYACCFFNFDEMIAWHDVKRCGERGGPGPNLDMRYLAGLGAESIAPLEWLAADQSGTAVADRATATASDLRRRLDEATSTWHGWTLRRASIQEGIRSAVP